MVGKNSLALAGRLNLAKSVIEVIPLYPMMTNKLPISCIDQIHKMQRSFMWGDTDWNRKLHAISWDTVMLPRYLRSTSLRDLNVLNQVCLMKLKLLEKIKACVPPSLDFNTDVFYFAGTGNKEFSIKEMFKTIDGHDIDPVDKDWNKIWKASVSERCRSFLWILKHDRLLTNFSKSKEGLGSASCNLCGSICESTIHATRDCHKCVSIWRSLVPSDIHGEFF